jgi:hypothetical protein
MVERGGIYLLTTKGRACGCAALQFLISTREALDREIKERSRDHDSNVTNGLTFPITRRCDEVSFSPNVELATQEPMPRLSSQDGCVGALIARRRVDGQCRSPRTSQHSHAADRSAVRSEIEILPRL